MKQFLTWLRSKLPARFGNSTIYRRELPPQFGNDGKYLKTDGTTTEWALPAGGGDMLAATYDPTSVEADAFDMDNMVEGTTNKILTADERTILGNTSGTNSGDQTLPVAGDFNHDDLANITGTPGEYNHPTDAQMTVLGNTSGENSGDQDLSGLIPKTQNTFMEDPTGFVRPENITATYNSTTRKITLTGTVVAYWNGEQVTALTTGWESAAHDETDGSWFLSYDGNAFSWSQTAWTFDKLQIAYVYYSTAHKFSIRETHGLMPWTVHKELHQTIGTYLGSGGDMSGYTLNSTTAAERRPLVSSTTVFDEDLPSTIAELATETYTQAYLTASGTPTFVTGANDIVPLTGAQPNYNLNTAGTWSQEPLPNNSYMAVWLVAVPTSNDAGSQAYRYLWAQGQNVSANLADVQTLTPNDLSFGAFSNISTEFVFVGKVIIRYQSANWFIVQVDKLTGNKISNTASASGYLSTVTTDGTIAGTGIVSDPLTLDGATIPTATVATTDKVFIHDADDSDAVKTVTAQSIADLYVETGLQDVVDDATPQLGGDLDTNANDIAFDTDTGINDENGNEQVRFKTTSSATNYIEIQNGATLAGASITAAGSDTNVDLLLKAKGTGYVDLDHPTVKIHSHTGTLRATDGVVGVTTTSDALTIGTIELGAASDTTISRVSAGVVAIEGKNILTTDGGTLTGNVTFGENTALILDPALSADGKYCGIVRGGTAGAALAFGDLVYLQAADSRWELADADAVGTAGTILLGICVLAANADGDATTILLHGTVRADTAFPTLTIGAPAYVSTTAGDIQVAAPTGADDVVRVVGYALTADELYFNPSPDHITHTG